MSDAISSVSSNSPSPAQPWQRVRNDYQSLSKALSQGDIQAAQKAYASIQQDRQNGPQPPATSAGSRDFGALGQALRNGDLDSAKQAFSSLQADFGNLRQTRGAESGHPSGGDTKASGASTDKIVASEITTTNANGALTVTTTYTDGTTSSEAEPDPSPMSQSSLASLLSAQERQALLRPAG